MPFDGDRDTMIIKHILEAEGNYALAAEVFRVFPDARRELVRAFTEDLRTALSEALGADFTVTCEVVPWGPTLQVRGVAWPIGVRVALVPDTKRATHYYVGLQAESAPPGLDEIQVVLHEATGVLKNPQNSWYWWDYLEDDIWGSESSPALMRVASQDYRAQVCGLIEHVVRVTDPFLHTTQHHEEGVL